jgi:ubiquinone/menaquinone biosynthesis C-methylase UbiE
VGVGEKVNYNILTETPGERATKEQLERIFQRYRFVREFALGKEVLEVACGSGMGLGYISSIAKRVVGVDIDKKNVAFAKELYLGEKNIQVSLMDAHYLSFPDNSMDLIFLFEAIYYLKNPAKFITEAKRVLKDDGVLMICTVNKDWEDFHKSPYTYKYFSVPELTSLIKTSFNDVSALGGFPVDRKGKNQIISFIKRAAVKFNLIPGSLKARSYLKRVFLGKLVDLPRGVRDGMAEYNPPMKIDPNEEIREFKIIYGMARK